MAGFIGVQWAPNQMRIILEERQIAMLPERSKTYTVSRSIHYGLFLAFEGIRFYVQKEGPKNNIVFVNLESNISRFQRGITYNLSDRQKHLIPTDDELRGWILAYLLSDELRPFIESMAKDKAQGYLRPFTIDEDHSIGVTFPSRPAIRLVAARYTSYLGEPFHGVVVPKLVRAVTTNGTGSLKLGVNYLISVKAVQHAQRVSPGAGSALFLDDRPDKPVFEREITEWDSSCFMVALKNGTVIKIADSPLILPSITVTGITSLLRERGLTVEDRGMTYGELVEHAKRDDIAALCSIGTAGILNRATHLVLVDGEDNILMNAKSDPKHPMYNVMGEARTTFWSVYTGDHPAPDGMNRSTFDC